LGRTYGLLAYVNNVHSPLRAQAQARVQAQAQEETQCENPSQEGQEKAGVEANPISPGQA